MHPTADTHLVIYFQSLGAAGDAGRWAASVIDTMKEVLKSLGGRLSLTIGLLFVVLITDSSSFELPLLKRHPFAWSFFWPTAIFPKADAVIELVASFTANLALYSLLTYAIISGRKVGGRRNLMVGAAQQRHAPDRRHDSCHLPS
jgi:hypothetical protein